MANPTTNFGWVMPTATDLVTDLPADFAVFGQGVDTSMADLLGGTTGQILSKTSATDMDFTWIANDQGDITGITATSPLTGGGSSGAITVGIQDATTSVKGSVQLSDSTSTTSSVLAATPTAVKSAYDLADAAIAKTTVTTAGDIIYRNATVPVRLGIGTVGQILTVNSGATAPEWATPAGGGGWTQIGSTQTLNGAASYSINTSAGYQQYAVLINNPVASGGVINPYVFFNGDTTTTNYYGYVQRTSGNSYQTAVINTPTVFYYSLDTTQRNNFSQVIVFNPDGDSRKGMFSNSFVYENATYVGASSVNLQWKNTAAITSVSVATDTGGNFTGGTYKLYGIK